MTERPKKSKGIEAKAGAPQFATGSQFMERRRRDLATRSILSRLRNRKSALK